MAIVLSTHAQTASVVQALLGQAIVLQTVCC